MANDLLHFQIGVLFGGIVVEQGLQVVDVVVLFIGNLQVGHHDVVRGICPAVVSRVVNAVGLA